MNKKVMKGPARPAKLIMIAAITMLMFTACSCGQTTADKPTVKIKAPAAGVAAGDVTIAVDVANFGLADAEGNQNSSGRGHIVYYLDTVFPTYYDHSALSPAGTFAVASATSYTWQGITPGPHTFAVQLVKDNITPLPAPVTDTITIEVGPPTGNPSITAINPADGDSMPPGNIIVEVQADNFIISQADMGVINRPSEGHLIYYFDEEPPVDPGIPALTDTSVVSTQTRYLWKNVSQGQHTIAVQLVNNNDTPLEQPVVKTVKLDIKPAE